MRNPAAARKLLTEEAIAAEATDDARRRPCLSLRLPLDQGQSGLRQGARNRYWFNEGAREGMLFQLNGEVFDKGLYAHADSTFTFPPGGKWKTFTATIGLREGIGHSALNSGE